MSLPPAPVAVAALGTTVALNPIEYVFTTLNTNPYFIGLMMLCLNLGGRFIGMEISKEQEKFLQQPIVRRALIFTVLFVATRNVFVALIMTIIALLLMSFLFNENSDLYLWDWPHDKEKKEPVATSGLTPEETEIWRRLNEKQLRLAAAAETAAKDKKEELSSKGTIEEIYAFNLGKIQMR
jgi:hypothetical protein